MKFKNLVVTGDRLFILALTFVLVIGYSGIVSVVGLGGSQSISSSGMISYTPQNITTGWFHTEGKYIKDSAGNIVRLKGTATLGMQNLWGTDKHAIRWNTDAQTEDLYEAIASTGANTVRVPINYALAYQSVNGGSLQRPDYIATLDSIVNFCTSLGLWVIFDFHSDYYNGLYLGVDDPTGNYSKRWQSAINDVTWKNEKIAHVQWFASRYKNNLNVIGIEIWNEPFYYGGWDAYGDPSRQAYFTTYRNWAYDMAHAIHIIEPHYLVFVDGIQTATTLVDWTYNGNQLLNEPNIVYTYHYYNWHFSNPGDQFCQDYRAGNYVAGKANMISRYYQRFWFLAEEYNVPIWYGEFGFWDTDVGGGANLQQLIKDQHQVHIDRGYSVNHWGCHPAMGESIVKQFTGTPDQIFNWKGLLWAQYMTL